MKSLVEMITTDNVVYLRTYKVLRQAAANKVAYKNRYFAMKPEEREKERARVAALLAANPSNVWAMLDQNVQEEVDNG